MPRRFLALLLLLCLLCPAVLAEDTVVEPITRAEFMTLLLEAIQSDDWGRHVLLDELYFRVADSAEDDKAEFLLDINALADAYDAADGDAITYASDALKESLELTDGEEKDVFWQLMTAYYSNSDAEVRPSVLRAMKELFLPDDAADSASDPSAGTVQFSAPTGDRVN